MDVATHIDALRVEGASMAAAAAGTDPERAVPSCPEWTARDLIRHTGAVHRWATGFVASGRTEPWGLEEAAGTWPADEDLASWLERGCSDLVAALTDAPDDLQCWTFLAAPSPRAMWARRQAHETAVHRVDAQLATGSTVTRCAPAFAADGIDEFLMLFVPRRGAALRAEPPASLTVRCRDVGASWHVRMDAEGVTTTTAGANRAGAACVVSGAAHDLYLALWHRAPGDDLEVAGDDTVLDRFSAAVRIR